MPEETKSILVSTIKIYHTTPDQAMEEEFYFDSGAVYSKMNSRLWLVNSDICPVWTRYSPTGSSSISGRLTRMTCWWSLSGGVWKMPVWLWLAAIRHPPAASPARSQAPCGRQRRRLRRPRVEDHESSFSLAFRSPSSPPIAFARFLIPRPRSASAADSIRNRVCGSGHCPAACPDERRIAALAHVRGRTRGGFGGIHQHLGAPRFRSMRQGESMGHGV